MACNIGEQKVIGGKSMKCVVERTHGRVYRKGCYWVYSEEDPYNHTEISEKDLDYYGDIRKHSLLMEHCIETGGYWLGDSCYYGGEEAHPPNTPQITPEPKEDSDAVSDKYEGESCGGAGSWLWHGIAGGRECAEGLECINGKCQKKSLGETLIGGVEKSLWSILVIGVLIVAALFALGYSGVGGAAGKAAEKRV